MVGDFKRRVLPLAIVILGASAVQASSIDDCLLNEIRSASNETTIGEVRDLCEMQVFKNSTSAVVKPGVVDERLVLEKSIEKRPWVITAHKSNYILGYSHNSDLNTAPFAEDVDVDGFKEEELKFQISLKFPLWYGVFGEQGDLYAAYTNQSWWQNVQRRYFPAV